MTTTPTPAQPHHAWAPLLAKAGRFRASARRHQAIADDYRAKAAEAEAEAEVIKSKTAA